MDKQNQLKRICEEYKIALVYIFGSQVKTGLNLLQGIKQELHDPLTDIDIGVVFDHELPSPKERHILYSNLYNHLEDLFLPYPLDLVFLQETHSVFQANAINGHCLYYSRLEFKEEYEENIFCRALDFRPFLEKYLDEILEEV